jgi:hypothetical protein
MKTLHSQYSYSKLKELLFEDFEFSKEDINLSLALDTMHEMIRRRKAEGDYDSYKIAKFVANLYDNVDPDELYSEWAEEEKLEHEDDFPPDIQNDDDEMDVSLSDDEIDALVDDDVVDELADEIFDIDESHDFLSPYKEVFGSDAYKHALEHLDELVKNNTNKQGKLSQTLEFYAMRVAKQYPMVDCKKLTKKYLDFYNPVFEDFLLEKLDPKSDVSVWIKDFQESDAPQFQGKSKEKRRKMAIAAWTSARQEKGITEETKLSDNEFDTILAQLLTAKSADNLLDAIEKENKKQIEKIIHSEIKDKNKAKAVITRLLK